MLILSRKVGEKIVIDGQITVVVNRISGGRVTLGVQAPSNVHIVRGELRVFDPSAEPPTISAPAPVPLSVPMTTTVGAHLPHHEPASITQQFPR